MKAIAVLCTLLVHYACAGSLGGRQNNPIARASNEFTMKLLQEQSQNSGSGNVLVSGLSAHAALTLLHQGAGSSTAQELARVLRLNSVNSNINQAYQSTMNDFDQDDNLNFVNKLFPSNQFQINHEFINKAQQYFQADVEKLDYSNPSKAAQQINNYVQQETNNKIRDLVNSNDLNSDTALLIINAIHFKAAWENPFYRSQQQEFHVSSSQKVRTEMMSQTGEFEYKDDNGLNAKILKMDYDENAQGYSMYFILPKTQNGLSSLETKLANANPANFLEGLRRTQVEVQIPKFKFEKTNNLKDTLRKMGASEIFSDNADFHKIADRITVSKVVQKALISVSENGTEAAAATSVNMQGSSANYDPITTFRANHPFFFAIAREDIILFAGKLMNPSSH